MRGRIISVFRRIALVTVLLSGLSACTPRSPFPDGAGTGVKLQTVRKGVPPGLLVKNLTVQKDRFEEALSDRGTLDRIRLIRIFKRGGATPNELPEYRVFDVDPNSAYALLGLVDGDVLVAADDWVVFNPQKFPVYVMLLKNQPGGEIEFRRAGQPILSKFRFVE